MEVDLLLTFKRNRADKVLYLFSSYLFIYLGGFVCLDLCYFGLRNCKFLMLNSYLFGIEEAVIILIWQILLYLYLWWFLVNNKGWGLFSDSSIVTSTGSIGAGLAVLREAFQTFCWEYSHPGLLNRTVAHSQISSTLYIQNCVPIFHKSKAWTQGGLHAWEFVMAEWSTGKN